MLAAEETALQRRRSVAAAEAGMDIDPATGKPVPQDKKKLSRVQKFVQLADKYGGKPLEPKDGPKTLEGATISLLFYSLIGYLAIVNCLRLYGSLSDGDRVYTAMGHPLLYNGDPGSWEPFLDIPPIRVVADGALIFYEASGRPSVQRVSLVDKTGYSPERRSSSAPVAVAAGVASRATVPLGSWLGALSPVPPARPPVFSSLRAETQERGAHSFGESLRAMWSEYDLLDASAGPRFFAHDAHLFVRFDPDQLKRVKMCQLQVHLSNAAEYRTLVAAGAFANASTQRQYQSKALFRSLRVPSYSWRPGNFLATKDASGGVVNVAWHPMRENLTSPRAAAHDGPVAGARSSSSDNGAFNVLHLSSHFGDADVAALRSATRHGPGGLDLAAAGANLSLSDYMDWSFGFNYANNFNQTVQRMVCDGAPDFNKAFGTTSALPAANATSVEVPHYNSTMFIKPPPFYVLLSASEGQERVTVHNYTKGPTHYRLHIRRAARPIDFTANGGGAAAANAANATNATNATGSGDVPLFPPNPPRGWACKAKLYNNRDGCHCECGVFDPDCYFPTQRVHGCESGDVCSKTAKCTPSADDSVASVSEPCAQLLLKGEFALVGFVGDEATYRAQSAREGGSGWTDGCPACFDQKYDDAPQLDQDGRLVCNFQPAGYGSSHATFAKEQTGDCFLEAQPDERVLNGTRDIEVMMGPTAGFPALGHGANRSFTSYVRPLARD